jgi:hypothetical protein
MFNIGFMQVLTIAVDDTLVSKTCRNVIICEITVHLLVIVGYKIIKDAWYSVLRYIYVTVT